MKIDLLVSQMQNKAQETNSGILGFSENEIVLFQNNPNPFSTDTEIRMVLPETSKQADLIIYPRLCIREL